MKAKRGGRATPAKKEDVATDEIDEIIGAVALWLRPGADLRELKRSAFYGLVRERVKGLARKVK
ncbi:MAG: hypothetical protein HZB92_02465 [Euryarchaeota archaeon]|nr:hypothetical protein [Euryarchaeota archaeon]